MKEQSNIVKARSAFLFHDKHYLRAIFTRGTTPVWLEYCTHLLSGPSGKPRTAFRSRHRASVSATHAYTHAVFASTRCTVRPRMPTGFPRVTCMHESHADTAMPRTQVVCLLPPVYFPPSMVVDCPEGLAERGDLWTVLQWLRRSLHKCRIKHRAR